MGSPGAPMDASDYWFDAIGLALVVLLVALL
jgi:hypothetical protein